MKMPSTTCQNFTTATAKRRIQWTVSAPEPGQEGVRTEVILEHGGAVEIDHVGRQAAETEVGKRGRILG
jgi:hypothetical protein